MFEKILAVETVISNFAANQFSQNGLSIEESMLVIKSIYLKLSEQYINQSISNRIEFVDQKDEIKPVSTGTMTLGRVEDLEKRD